MRVILYFIIAIGLIGVGVFESASMSADDFKRRANNEAVVNERSIRSILALGSVGSLIALKIISDGRQTVMQKGNERFLAPGEVLIKSDVD
tara:strand:- start:608 stop:880 length:273 start_codon:yes stop_codon:yes gene_type:complete